ncbi:MAG TPA: hypothetical protein VLQ79_06065, partial [Myxococcaceae bacterium]|nr:hypothetical protein [Myxococcaceae bacterium]
NVWKTGDTTALDGTNVIAFRGGLELAGIKNRAYPPLQYFYAAPFLGVLGRNALAARLPFALAGLAGFFLWSWWLLREAPNRWFTTLTAIFTLGNVSLFLYLRQSRYYGLAFALALAFVYLYLHRGRSGRHRVLLALTGVTLLACHYLTYGATMVCLAVDYLLFERRRQRDSWRQIAVFLATQVAGLCAVVGIFFPFGRKVTPYVPASWWHDKLVLFWWNLRDLNATECFWLPLLAIGALVAIARRDAWLGRAVLALLVFAAVASVLSPQPVGWATFSDIRYMSTTLPLTVFISARTLWLGAGLDRPAPVRVTAALGLAAVLAFTNIANVQTRRLIGGPGSDDPIRSTLLTWLGELVHPQRSAYAEASASLNPNLPRGSNVFSVPDFSLYPLMFHAPQHRYMWQFSRHQRADFPMLQPFNFRFLETPDAIVAFGSEVGPARSLVQQLEQLGVRYEAVDLGVAGPDATRPELFWHRFRTSPPRPGDDTWIVRRVSR